jgi:hypothetical protein
VASTIPPTGRTFKTAWFSKVARKAHIKDDELCGAIQQLMKGQADDLGGGVFKKRLNRNMHRAIVILARIGPHWTFEYLFAKQDRDNIADDELAAFRLLARGYENLTDRQLTQLLHAGDLTEICHDGQT